MITNYNDAPLRRLWIFWSNNLDVHLVQISAQYIHCQMFTKDNFYFFFTTFAYASNSCSERRNLWILLGYFNVIRRCSGTNRGVVTVQANSDKFNACLEAAVLEDHPFTGHCLPGLLILFSRSWIECLLIMLGTIITLKVW